MGKSDNKYWINKIENDLDKSVLEDIFIADTGKADNFENIYYAINGLKDYKRFNKEEAWKNINGKINKSRFLFVKYAAVIIFLLGIGFSYLILNNNQEIYFSGDNDLHLVLEDGSDIVLSPHSELIVENDFNTEYRNVVLKGDGYFNITRNENKPFIIKASDTKIQVLGTVFYINQESGKVNVNLVSGKVKVENNNGQEAILKSMHSAVVSDNISVKSIPNIESINENYADLIFDNTKIKVIVAKLNSIYNKEIIELEDNELGDTTIHIALRNSSVREFLNGLKLIFNVDIINSKGKYIIKTLKK